MSKRFKVFLQGRTTELMATSRSSALLTALEFYPNQRIYRVVEMYEWDDDNDN
jgi:hypothetical protein